MGKQMATGLPGADYAGCKTGDRAGDGGDAVEPWVETSYRCHAAGGSRLAAAFIIPQTWGLKQSSYKEG